MKSPVDDRFRQSSVLPTLSHSSPLTRHLQAPPPRRQRHAGESPAIRPPTLHRRWDAAPRRLPRPSADRRRGEPPRRGVHLVSVSTRRPSLCRRRVVDAVLDLLLSIPRRSLPVKLHLDVLERQRDSSEVGVQDILSMIIITSLSLPVCCQERLP